MGSVALRRTCRYDLGLPLDHPSEAGQLEDKMTANRWFLHKALGLLVAVLATSWAASALSKDVVAQTPLPAINCSSTKPLIVDTTQFAALFRVLNEVPVTAKSEWETTNAYMARRQAALNVALAKSQFKCPRFIARVPISSEFDADTEMLNTKLDNVPGNRGIVGDEFTVSDAAPRPKPDGHIKECLRLHLYNPSIYLSYKAQSYLCRK